MSSWYRVSTSLTNGINVINKFDVARTEHFVKRILDDASLPSDEIFTQEELHKLQKIFTCDEKNLLLAIKTVQYLYKRMLKFIFKPLHLRNDLLTLGLSEEKAELFVKIWSAEIKPTLFNTTTYSTRPDCELSSIKWGLGTQLSSDITRISKTATGTLRLSGKGDARECTVEMTQDELYQLLIQLQSTQMELDNLM